MDLHKTLKKIWRYRLLYLMILPGLCYLIVNNYIPMAGSIVAFKQFSYQKGIWGSPFIGLKNFKFLFASPDAWLITRNTLAYNFAFIVLDAVIAVLVAVILNELTNKRARKIYMSTTLLPYMISIVVVSYMVYGFLSKESGFLNNVILPLFGKEGISWYTTISAWPGILILVHVWKYFGYNCIIYYSVVVGIDRGYYESAAIDGAGRWMSFRYITLPSLMPTISIMTLMAVGRIFYSDFGLFYQVTMNSGSIMDVTNTIDTYVYRSLTQTFNIGMSSAAGLYQSVMGFILVLGANLITRRISPESALF
jgi:putative aldouronate transport system permease protein